MNVGKNIAALREAAGMTQVELAEQVGVTSSMICQIERGSKVPSVLLAKLIADAIGSSIDALLGEDCPF